MAASPGPGRTPGESTAATIMREVNIIILLRKYDLIGVVSYGFGCGSEYEGRIDYEIMEEHVPCVKIK